MRIVKWLLLGAGVLVLVVVGVIVYFVATFDPNAYVPRIAAFVKERTGRTLTVNGKVSLAVFPKLGASIADATLSEPNSTKVFARVDDARVSLALWPLLKKQVVVDRVTLKGLGVDLVRYKDGHTNFDDLTGQPAERPAERPAQQPPSQGGGGRGIGIDVGGITVENASVGWRDERAGTSVRLSNVDLKTGRIASGVPGKLEFHARVQGTQPKVSILATLDTGYQLDFGTGAVALSALAASVVGDAPGFTGLDARLKGEKVDLDPAAQRVTLSRVDLSAKSKDGLDAQLAVPQVQLAPDRAESQAITGNIKLASAQRTIDATLKIAPIAAKGKQLQLSRVDVDLTAKQGERSVQGTITSPVAIDLERQHASLPTLMVDVTISDPSLPSKSAKASVSGAARADWGASSASADLALKLDDSNIQTKVTVAHWANPAITFTVAADRLNVDRYLPPSPPATAPAGGTGESGPEQPIDLSALKTLDAAGDLKVGALQVRNIKAEQIALRLKAAGGRLDISPMSATLYSGSLTGTLSVNANDSRFAVKQDLKSVSVGPLLRDAANKDLLEGTGNVGLNLTTTGTTVTALKKALAGTASIALRDGSIKGIDIAGMIRKAKAVLGSQTALQEQAQGGAKTDFAELTASFTIQNGVAHNDDLLMKSPLLRVSGSGNLDIAAGTLDYTTRASVVATTKGQGGKELADLSGVTVPVHATGPLASLKYRVDVGAMVTDVVKGRIQQEIERRLGGTPGGKAGDAAGAIGGALKGLFGRQK